MTISEEHTTVRRETTTTKRLALWELQTSSTVDHSNIDQLPKRWGRSIYDLDLVRAGGRLAYVDGTLRNWTIQRE